MKYSEYRIDYIKKQINAKYEKLSPEETKITMPQIYEQGLTGLEDKYLVLISRINTLVEMKHIDFDENSSLEKILKLINK